LTEETRHFEPALLVESGSRASSKAIHPLDVVPLAVRDHFLPLLARFGH
jgi:hypothetical protein